MIPHQANIIRLMSAEIIEEAQVDEISFIK